MTWWQYLMLANVYLILFYGFYALLLRRETFFQLNRVYLVGSAILSFMIPLMQAEWARNLFITRQINQTIYQLNPVVIYQLEPRQNDSVTIGQGLAIIYITGIVLLLLRFMLQVVLLRRNLKQTNDDDAYSFFKSIKLSEKLINNKLIMAHEQVHAQQWHSADVLLIEAIMITNWFNPAVYLYRKAIKHVHEFIADSNALKAGANKQEYALLLLSETFKTPANQLVNPFFSHSLLKQRIIMLQKDHSRRTALIKYGLSAPLFALMIILSSATVKTNTVINKLNDKAAEIMLMQAAPIDNNTNVIKAKQPPVEVAVKDFQPKPKAPVFTRVEHEAEFPGGLAAFGKFLAKNIKMTPEIKKEMTQQGPLIVIVQFVVEEDGSLSTFNVLRGTGQAALEAVRVLSISPRWKPGVQNGRAVRQQYTVPINFTLEAPQKVGIISKKNLNDQDRGINDTVKAPTLIINSKTGDSSKVVYYVDGVRADHGLGFVHPNDIKSMNILKNNQKVGEERIDTILITTKNKH